MDGDWAPVVVIVLAVIGSHAMINREVRALHRDIAGLRERLAKLEGKVDTLISAFVGSQHGTRGGAQGVANDG